MDTLQAILLGIVQGSKTGRDEMAMLVSVTGIVIVLLMLVGEIATLLNTIKALFGL